MPARNRVTPMGDIVAAPLRGAWTGNRGKVHEGHEIVRFHSGKLWIICALRFRERWHPLWQPNHYTFLFFHDEAVAFAAGHRPCSECRHGAYLAYVDAWAEAAGGGRPTASVVNSQLHSERLYPRSHRRRMHELPYRQLPDGGYVLYDGRQRLVLGDSLVAWTPRGYGGAVPRPSDGTADVITPPSTLAVLRAGYPVQIDDSAYR